MQGVGVDTGSGEIDYTEFADLGFLPKGLAALLAPPLDSGALRLTECRCQVRED